MNCKIKQNINSEVLKLKKKYLKYFQYSINFDNMNNN